MDVIVNGETTTAPEGITLAQFLTEQGFTPTAVVVERNGVLVPGKDFSTTVLTPSDSLEVLHFVGGG